MTTASIRPDFLTALDDTYTTAITGENLDGHWGNDTIHGNLGDDTLNGGADDDAVYGGDGNDKVSGGYGNDFVDGGTGNDTVIGGYGNDTLNGGEGVDLYYAGDGDDLLIVDFEAAQVGMDSVIGGNGSDTLRLNLAAADYANATVFAALQELVTDAADGWGIRGFKGYEALNLFVNKMETIEIYVDGALTDPFAPPPLAFSATLIKGIDDGDGSGVSVSSAGDVDGDGLDDVIIGAYAADPDGVSGAGESYLVYGSALAASGGTIDLATLSATQGVLIKGIDAGDYSGIAVASAGDVDGDGKDDVIIGARQATSDGALNAGESYLMYGSALEASGGVIDLATLSAVQGVLIKGIDGGDLSGHSVGSIGDIDGDGLDDVIIGANGADPGGVSNAGEGYLVYGSALAASGGTLDLATLSATQGVLIRGIDASDFSGNPVSSAGDVDGDGKEDLIIGAFRADPDGALSAGESYLVYGSALESSGGVIDLATLSAAQGVLIKGIDAGDFSGRSVTSAGDVDGDGLDDVIIGANGADKGGLIDAGESYLIYGSALAGSGGVIDLATLSASQGVLIKGIDAGDYSGFSVSSAGDVDGDGKDDVIIGAYFADPDGASDAGESYVLSGALLAAEKLDDGIIDLADPLIFV